MKFFLQCVLGIVCTFMGIVIDRYLLWEPPSTKPIPFYRVDNTQTLIPLSLTINCSKDNINRAKRILKTCYSAKGGM
jgi:hypothetical protein